jgi:Domain of unknown function (DUF6378)
LTDARQTATRLAQQVNEIVGARGTNYGPPEDNFANIANFWNAWIHARYKALIALDSVDVGIMSSLIKTARLAQTPKHEDSALDAAIYTLLGFGCGVSDREPGMTDFSFYDERERESDIDLSTLPVAPDDGRLWFYTKLVHPSMDVLVDIQLLDGEIVYSQKANHCIWSVGSKIIRWRYAEPPREVKPEPNAPINLNYEGAMADLDAALEVLINRITGEKDLASAKEWLRLNYPDKYRKIRYWGDL